MNPAEITRYPEDCGRPHIWERMTSIPQCDCVHCYDGIPERWLECRDCLTLWPPDDTEAWTAAWEKA